MRSRTATSSIRQLIALFAMAFCCASVGAVEPPDGWRMVLSWSPLYCSANLTSKEPQCSEEYYFVNHGLVPFRRSGPAEKDDSCAEWDMSDADSDRWLWVIPNKIRVRSLWRKHGSCSGLDTTQYLAAVDRGEILRGIEPTAGAVLAPERAHANLVRNHPEPAVAVGVGHVPFGAAVVLLGRAAAAKRHQSVIDEVILLAALRLLGGEVGRAVQRRPRKHHAPAIGRLDGPNARATKGHCKQGDELPDR